MNILYWLPVLYSIGTIVIVSVVPQTVPTVFAQGFVLSVWTIGIFFGIRWNRWKGVSIIQPISIITLSIIAWWVRYLSAEMSDARFWLIAGMAIHSVGIVGWYAAIVFIPARSVRLMQYQHWVIVSGVASIVAWALTFWTVDDLFIYYSFGQTMILMSILAWVALQCVLWAITASRSRFIVRVSLMSSLFIVGLLWMPVTVGVRMVLLGIVITVIMGRNRKLEIVAG